MKSLSLSYGSVEPLSDPRASGSSNNGVKWFTRAVGFLVSLFVIVVVVSSSKYTPPTAAEAVTYPSTDSLAEISSAGSLADHPTTKEEEDDEISIIITPDDLVQLESVQKYYKSLGMDAESFIRRGYLPGKMSIKYRPSEVQGKVGSGAMDGLVAFSLQHRNLSATDISPTGAASAIVDQIYNVVLSLNGTVVAFSPMWYWLNSTAETTYGHWHPTSWHVYQENPSYIIIGMNKGNSQDGTVFLWNWDGTMPDEYLNVMNLTSKFDVHDVSSVWNSSDKACKFWVAHPNSDGKGGGGKVYRGDGSTNCESSALHSIVSSDVNHLQLIDQDRTAIVSDRGSSAIIKMSTTTDGSDADLVFVVGGDYGTYPIIDLNGAAHSPGSTVWSEQHNAEFFGENEYFMFDNFNDLMPNDDDASLDDDGADDDEGYVGNFSRALIVNIDETAEEAKMVWQYNMGYYTARFGDADRVTNGNVQISAWVSNYSDDNQFDMQVLEVSRENHGIVWDLKIFSMEAEKYLKSEYFELGWSTYSTERMFVAPVVYDLDCVTTSSSSVDITLTTLNRFKQNNLYPGVVRVMNSEGTKVLTHNFDFKPYFSPTQLILRDITDMSSCSGTVHVENQWGDVTAKQLEHSQ